MCCSHPLHSMVRRISLLCLAVIMRSSLWAHSDGGVPIFFTIEQARWSQMPSQICHRSILNVKGSCIFLRAFYFWIKQDDFSFSLLDDASNHQSLLQHLLSTRRLVIYPHLHHSPYETTSFVEIVPCHHSSSTAISHCCRCHPSNHLFPSFNDSTRSMQNVPFTRLS